MALRADAGYFAADLAAAAHFAGIDFAIGANASPHCGACSPGSPSKTRAEATCMHGAQVAVADYRPAWWPANNRLLIRRVALDPEQVSADPRSRRRRTLHPDQRALPVADLAATDPIYGYSFILTNRDVSTAQRAARVEHWYRHRTECENIFRDGKHGAGLFHLPSGHAAVNTAWMWGASIATRLAGWLHQLTATSPISGNPDTATEPDQAEPDQAEPERAIPLVGLGVAGGKAMIETLQHRVIRVPGRLIHHAGAPVLRLPHGDHLLAEVLARLRALPTRPS